MINALFCYFFFITCSSAQELKKFDGNWSLLFCNSSGKCVPGTLKVTGSEGVFMRSPTALNNNNCAGKPQKANKSTNENNDLLVEVEKYTAIQGCEGINFQFKKIKEKEYEAGIKMRNGDGKVIARLD